MENGFYIILWKEYNFKEIVEIKDGYLYLTGSDEMYDIEEFNIISGKLDLDLIAEGNKK